MYLYFDEQFDNLIELPTQIVNSNKIVYVYKYLFIYRYNN